MAKVAIALKVDPEKHASLKKRADQEGKTISDILQEGLNVSEKIGVLEHKLAESQRENQELRDREQKRVNRKLPTQITKTVSFKVTLSEYDALSRIAQERNTSRPKLLRDMFTRSGPQLTQLTVNG